MMNILAKEPFSIDVIENGITISVNDEQLLNAYSPIDVTNDGIEISLNDEHS